MLWIWVCLHQLLPKLFSHDAYAVKEERVEASKILPEVEVSQISESLLN